MCLLYVSWSDPPADDIQFNIANTSCALCCNGALFLPCRFQLPSYAIGISFVSYEYEADFDEICERGPNHYHQRLTYYIFGEIGTGNRRPPVFRHDVKEVLTPSERIHKFHSTHCCQQWSCLISSSVLMTSDNGWQVIA